MQFEPEQLSKFCTAYIPGFEPEKFRLVAVRLFCGKEIMLTIYTEEIGSNKTLSNGRYPVKKIKTEIRSAAELLAFASAFNFTVANPEYNLDAMEITNK